MFDKIIKIVLIISSLIVLATVATQQYRINAYKAKVVTLEAANAELTIAYGAVSDDLSKLEGLRELDSQVIMSLQGILKENWTMDDKNREKQAKLEKQSPSVAAFVNTPVDPALKRLLDDEDRVYSGDKSR